MKQRATPIGTVPRLCLDILKQPLPVNIPMTDAAEISNIISYWTRKARRW